MELELEGGKLFENTRAAASNAFSKAKDAIQNSPRNLRNFMTKDLSPRLLHIENKVEHLANTLSTLTKKVMPDAFSGSIKLLQEEYEKVSKEYLDWLKENDTDENPREPPEKGQTVGIFKNPNLRMRELNFHTRLKDVERRYNEAMEETSTSDSVHTDSMKKLKGQHKVGKVVKSIDENRVHSYEAMISRLMARKDLNYPKKEEIVDENGDLKLVSTKNDKGEFRDMGEIEKDLVKVLKERARLQPKRTLKTPASQEKFYRWAESSIKDAISQIKDDDLENFYRFGRLPIEKGVDMSVVIHRAVEGMDDNILYGGGDETEALIDPTKVYDTKGKKNPGLFSKALQEHESRHGDFVSERYNAPERRKLNMSSFGDLDKTLSSNIDNKSKSMADSLKRENFSTFRGKRYHSTVAGVLKFLTGDLEVSKMLKDYFKRVEGEYSPEKGTDKRKLRGKLEAMTLEFLLGKYDLTKNGVVIHKQSEYMQASLAGHSGFKAAPTVPAPVFKPTASYDPKAFGKQVRKSNKGLTTDEILKRSQTLGTTGKTFDKVQGMGTTSSPTLVNKDATPDQNIGERGRVSVGNTTKSELEGLREEIKGTPQSYGGRRGRRTGRRSRGRARTGRRSRGRARTGRKSRGRARTGRKSRGRRTGRRVGTRRRSS